MKKSKFSEEQVAYALLQTEQVDGANDVSAIKYSSRSVRRYAHVWRMDASSQRVAR